MKFPRAATALLLFSTAPVPVLSQTTTPLRIVTFNIRYAATTLSTNEKPWTSSTCASSPTTCRKPHVITHLSQLSTNTTSTTTTLIGLQEVLDGQLTDIKTGLGSAWAHIGVGRDDGVKKGEYSPILYRTDVLGVVFNETKWLSPTPDKVSFGWGAGSRRVVTIGVFESKSTGKRFIHANTHLDNASGEARTEGVKVVLARIQAVQKTWGPLGVVLTGDFNSARGAEAHKVVTESGYMEELFDLATAEGKVRGANRVTFTGFKAGNAGTFIDFIWVGPKADKWFTLQGYEIMDNVAQGVYFSNHRAVVGDATLVA